MTRTPFMLIVAGLVLVGAGVAGGRIAPSADRQSAPGTVAIRGVRVFDGERVVPATTVVVRDGRIAAVGGDVPASAEIVEGAGRTLLPGLIDAHTHAFGDALDRALQFGVTTELDMFTDHRFAAAMRAQQRSPDGAPGRADLFSAGTLITAPKGHGTEYGLPIPTLTTSQEAQAFVDARIAEGSDYIKIVYLAGDPATMRMPSIDRSVLEAAVAAARARGKLAVVHANTRQAAEDAIAAGASGLVHGFGDAPADPAWIQRTVRGGAFVIPTLTVQQSAGGVAGAAHFLKDERLAPFLTPAERSALQGSFPAGAFTTDMATALTTVKRLHDAGVPILAGTDAPNPGTTHGVSMHRELELLAEAGLSPVDALAAATSVPARVFSLGDRGRIAPGLRADLLLVEGDPTTDITATRSIVAIWKGGRRVERNPPAPAAAAAPVTGSGVVSTFESGEPAAEFGAGWQISTDDMMGGTSTAAMRVIDGGAGGSTRSLEVTGSIVSGTAYTWAGAMFFPSPTPMNPADLSRFKEIVFWARGDGGEYQLMVFAARLGNIPAVRPFTAGAEWQEHAIPLAAFSNIDGSDVRGVLFSAGSRPGPFRFQIDEVRFR